MSEYTPTTDEVERVYSLAPVNLATGGKPNDDPEYARAQFKRFLAAHDAEVARKTLEDAALLALEWFPVEMLDGGGYWGARFANIVRARAASISTDKAGTGE